MGKEFDGSNLDVKGNAWVAAFPTPNRSIRLPTIGGNDPTNGEFDLLTEDFESDVDNNPEKYDFLGKGIDSGFRIAKNSSRENFTISPALAYLLCRAYLNRDVTEFHREIVIQEPQVFKGVASNQAYPVLFIPLNKNKELQDLFGLEDQLLGRVRQSIPKFEPDLLMNYLEKYMNIYKIEIPSLRFSTGDGKTAHPPLEYKNYIEELRKEIAKLENDKASQISKEDHSLMDDKHQMEKAMELIEAFSDGTVGQD